jgi:MFS family permease
MLTGLTIFILTVKERKWADEMAAETERLGLENTAPAEDNVEKRSLSKAEFRSLALILASVALWYIGYNSITSKYSVYATNVLFFDFNFTLIIAQAAAIVAYIPVGIIASKIGRKKTILAGVVMLFAAFAGAIFVKQGTNIMVVNLLFSLAGIGWATINVNSYPMVVEMSRGSNVGKYTGYYYTASMAAQTITPLVSGFLMDTLGMKTLFPYAAIFAACAFVTMLFVRHGDSKPTK